MSKIEDLVKQYCPNGVEYDIIKNLCKISRGRVMSKEYLRDNFGEYPVYSSQTVNQGMLGKINTYDYDGEYLTWTTDGANAGSVFYRKGKFSVTNVCGLLTVITSKMNIKFLHYYLGTVTKKYVNEGMGNPKLMSNVMAMIKVAVPPLPVQEEIVRILDAFSSLEAELEARKKQYEHYRNKLLTFNENSTDGKIKFMKLGEISKVQRGKRLTKNQLLENGKFPVYHGGIEPLGYYNQKNREKDTVMVINVGASAGTVGYSDTDFWSSDGCFCISHSNLYLNKYVYYVLKTKEQVLQSKVRKAGIPTLDNSEVEKTLIPIFPLEEQQRIVAILDKFDSLVNDISEGLPAELNARRQQYEYYRNKLLTFDEAA